MRPNSRLGRRSALPLGHRKRRRRLERECRDVLQVRDIEAIATGRAYAQLLEPDNVQARFDTVEIAAARRRPRRRLSHSILHPTRSRRGNQTLGRGHRPLVCRTERQAGPRARHGAGHQRALRARTPAQLISPAMTTSPASSTAITDRHTREDTRRSGAISFLLRLSPGRHRQSGADQRIPTASKPPTR